ncbi:hypothetical protein EDC01DRAFT_788349 [Geopyxis carbonaria]|nr:hypothetical protein EDC01DRAFT_788349 [Geopyxis carbonaria]
MSQPRFQHACRYYARGHCRYGESCKFLHGDASTMASEQAPTRQSHRHFKTPAPNRDTDYTDAVIREAEARSLESVPPQGPTGNVPPQGPTPKNGNVPKPGRRHNNWKTRAPNPQPSTSAIASSTPQAASAYGERPHVPPTQNNNGNPAQSSGNSSSQHGQKSTQQPPPPQPPPPPRHPVSGPAAADRVNTTHEYNPRHGWPQRPNNKGKAPARPNQIDQWGPRTPTVNDAHAKIGTSQNWKAPEQWNNSGSSGGTDTVPQSSTTNGHAKSGYVPPHLRAAPPARPDNAKPRLPPKTHTQTMGGNLSVTFSAGLAITSVVPIDGNFAASSLVLLSLDGPDTAARKSAVVNLLAPLTTAVETVTLVSAENETVDAVVRLASAAHASAVAVLLDSTTFEGRAVSTKSLQSWLTTRAAADGGGQSVTSIECAWFRPSRAAFVSFPDPQTAKVASERKIIRIRGQEARTRLERNKAKVVMLIGLPVQTTRDDIETVFPNCTAVDLKEPRYRLFPAETLAQIQAAFGPAAKVNVVTKTDDSRQCAFITFPTADRGEAEAMYARHLDRPQAFLGGARLELKLSFTIKFRIHSLIYDAISAEIERLVAAQCTGGNTAAYPKLKVVPRIPNVAVRLLIQSREKATVARLKASIQSLIRGETVIDAAGQARWDPSLATHAGRALILAAVADHNVHAYCDPRHRTITLYGAPAARATARAALAAAHQQLLDRPPVELRLYPWQMKHALAGGLDAVKALLGEPRVGVDLERRTVLVRCSAEELREVRALLGIKEGPAAAAVPDVAGRRTTGEGEGECPVCLTPPEDPVTPPCGHAHCAACLDGFFAAALASRTFPLRCISCAEAFPLPFLTATLPVQIFTALLTAVFGAYVNTHPTEYSFCPTADCDAVYVPSPPPTSSAAASATTSPTTSCPTCFTAICTSCRTVSHAPHTCIDYQRILNPSAAFATWRALKDVHPCPNCSADIEKDGGCPHVTCAVCRTEMCFSCTPPRAFPTSGEVYAHIRAVHPDGGAVRAARETEEARNDRLLRELLEREGRGAEYAAMAQARNEPARNEPVRNVPQRRAGTVQQWAAETQHDLERAARLQTPNEYIEAQRRQLRRQEAMERELEQQQRTGWALPRPQARGWNQAPRRPAPPPRIPQPPQEEARGWCVVM